MEYFYSIVRFIQNGGIFMYPIMITLAIGLAIALERYLYLGVIKRRNKVAWEHIHPLMLQGKVKSTLEYVRGSDAHISKVLFYTLTHLVSGRKVDEVEKMLEEGLVEIIPQLEKRTHFLGTFANIATLLGLLGTILGLIAAFSAVANADPAEKANLLSSSISVAMNTTAFGLITAIPLLLLHSFISTKTNEIVDSMDIVTVKLNNLININKNANNGLTEIDEVTKQQVTLQP
ncbi:MotA/TolQ/ExbB proton channel family protein [Shewanella sedimentimangrovi]|uniref:MotA/TolQ/ExbB proton channel family protein n=1 Tax=Shewanella sedimentimangrovi TaxID=2814293 RepID=A0ABX7R5S1_9GAMM|nr:MotA/TolQ/ExbB proton channel family protein [Shewanella sedimentimangrovi]QSX38135.1 MotA/TolQ/ExbB proton channel family protein [Shewanella sedimentimangrovi]